MVRGLKKIKRAYSAGLLILLVILSWWFLFGKKGRLGGQFLTPAAEKILGKEEKSSQPKPGVLGEEEEASGEKQTVLEKETQKIIGQSTQKVIEESSKVLQTSVVAEPIREIQEIVRQRMNEMIETIKELPAKEIKNVKREVCKQWLEEDQH
jgi:hypothetical protein